DPPSPTSQRTPAQRKAVDRARSLARSALAYVPAMAARQAFARSDHQTQTQHPTQRSDASSQFPQLTVTSYWRKPLIGNCRDFRRWKAAGQSASGVPGVRTWLPSETELRHDGAKMCHAFG